MLSDGTEAASVLLSKVPHHFPHLDHVYATVCAGFLQGGKKLRERIEPNDKPVDVPEVVEVGAHYARKASGTCVCKYSTALPLAGWDRTVSHTFCTCIIITMYGQCYYYTCN